MINGVSRRQPRRRIDGGHHAAAAARRSATTSGPTRRTSRSIRTRTSLSGFTGRVNLNRNSGLVQVNALLWGVSPGFESNDLGFHSNGDRAGAHAVVIWRNVTPGRVIRSRTTLGREVLELELRARAAGRRRRHADQRHVHELLVGGRSALREPARARTIG